MTAHASDAARRVTRRAMMAGLVIPLTLSRPTEASPSVHPLFRIERNTNANVVHYDAVASTIASLDPGRPIVAYWIMHAEHGQREALTAFEEKAYGFTVKPEPGSPNTHLMILRAWPRRAMRVLRWSNRWVAQGVIAGASAVLERIHVTVDHSAIIPRVRYFDAFGVDMRTGNPVTERIWR